MLLVGCGVFRRHWQLYLLLQSWLYDWAYSSSRTGGRAMNNVERQRDQDKMLSFLVIDMGVDHCDLDHRSSHAVPFVRKD